MFSVPNQPGTPLLTQGTRPDLEEQLQASEAKQFPVAPSWPANWTRGAPELQWGHRREWSCAGWGACPHPPAWSTGFSWCPGGGVLMGSKHLGEWAFVETASWKCPEAIKLQSHVVTKSSEQLQFNSNLCFHATIAHALDRRLPLPHFCFAVFLLLLSALQHCPSGIIPYLWRFIPYHDIPIIYSHSISPLSACSWPLWEFFSVSCLRQSRQARGAAELYSHGVGMFYKQGDVSGVVLPSSHHTLILLMLLCFQHSEHWCWCTLPWCWAL